MKVSLLATLVLTPAITAQTLEDINQVGVPDLVNIGSAQLQPVNQSYPFPFTAASLLALNGGWLTTVDTVAAGRELWFTDGTPAGTQLLVDAVPGGFGSEPNNLKAFRGGALFTATEAPSDAALWFTDGTPAGTHKLWVSTSQDIADLVVVGGMGYFLAGKDAAGPLWKTDGTVAGTVEIALSPGTLSSKYVDDLAVLPGSQLFCFTATTTAHGRELWISDGTSAGTQLLADLVPGSFGSAPQNLTPWASRLVFTASAPGGDIGLFVTDGTTAGTQLAQLFPFTGASISLALQESATLAGDLYFPADLGAGKRLHRFDGTSVVEVAAVEPKGLIPFAGQLYFIGASAVGKELWCTDGTAAGTVLVKDIAPGAASGVHDTYVQLTVANGKLWFTGQSDGATQHLWMSDGTSAGTVDVQGAGVPGFGNGARHVTPIDQTRVLFAAEQPGGARGLWLSDGTPAGMQSAVTWDGGNGSSDPRWLVSPDGRGLLFRADDGVHGPELYGWKAAGGAQLVADLVPGAAGSEPAGLAPRWCGGQLLTFFTADTPSAGREVWVTDGTAGGTVRLVDAEPGAGDGVDEEVLFTAFGERVAFIAGTTTPRLYVTDGTPTGTLDVYGASPLGTLEAHYEHAALGDRLLFSTRGAPFQYDFWSTDGTAAGTTHVAAFDMTRPYDLTHFDEGLVFVAQTQAHGYELWKTDGTPGGTVVHDLEPGALGSEPRDLVQHDGALYFVADTAATSDELWRLASAGSAPVLISAMWPLGVQAEYRSFASSGDGLFFTSKPAFATSAPWVLRRTFGVPNDAAQVGFGGGTIDDHVSGLFGVGRGVVVTTTGPTGAAQLRLVAGDGVVTLTALPGAAPGPRELVVAGSRLFFNADFGDVGRELGSIELPGAFAGDLGGSTSGASLTLTPPRIGLGSVVRMEGLPSSPGFVALVHSFPSPPYTIPAVANGAGIWLAPGSLNVSLFSQVGTQFQLGIALPPDPGLKGLALHVQGLHLPSAGGAMAATNGVKLVLGD